MAHTYSHLYRLQTTVLRFSNLQRNPSVNSSEFRFDPPKGADVLGDK